MSLRSDHWWLNYEIDWMGAEVISLLFRFLNRPHCLGLFDECSFDVGTLLVVDQSIEIGWILKVQTGLHSPLARIVIEC